MKGSYGSAMYGVQVGKGTPAACTSVFGIVDRPHRNIRGGVEPLFSVGDWNAVEISEGMTLAEVGLSIPAVQDPHFIQQAKRSAVSGELPWLTVQIGYAKGTDLYKAVIQDCKIDTLTLRLEAGGRMNADLALIGGKVMQTAADPGAMSFFSSRAYRWFEATWDETRDLLSIELSVRNNLTPQPVIAGTVTTRDPERMWDFLDEGRADVGGRLQYFLADAAADLQDCLLAGTTHVLTIESCGDISPAQSMTLTLDNLKATDDDLQIPSDGNIVIDVPWLATDWTLAG